MVKLNRRIFWLKIDLLKNIILFRIRLVVALKKCDSRPAYNKKFLKTKIKSYGDDATDFFDKKIPNTYLAVILIAKWWKIVSVSICKWMLEH